METPTLKKKTVLKNKSLVTWANGAIGQAVTTNAALALWKKELETATAQKACKAA